MNDLEQILEEASEGEYTRQRASRDKIEIMKLMRHERKAEAMRNKKPGGAATERSWRVQK